MTPKNTLFNLAALATAVGMNGPGLGKQSVDELIARSRKEIEDERPEKELKAQTEREKYLFNNNRKKRKQAAQRRAYVGIASARAKFNY